jgi:hypothetical protein
VKIEKESVCGRLGVTSFDETTLAKVLRRLPGVEVGGPWLAGGAVRRTLGGEKLDSDFDFFFASKEQAEAFAEAIMSAGGIRTAQREKASTFIVPAESPEEDVFLPEITVQAITFAYFTDPEAVIDSFDFTLSQFAFDGESLYVGPFSLWDVARRRIVVNKVTYGVSTVRRLLKYTKQGYTVCSGALATILTEVVEHPEVIHAETHYID